VVAEVRGLVARGYREVELLGQNVNSYQGGCSLAELLERVSEVDGLEWIRFTTSHPMNFTEALARTLVTNPKVAPFLHLPVQSGSDAVLRRMRREYTVAQYLERLAYLGDARERIHLSTDFIVGFPGETEADFQATLDVVRAARFAGAFTFQYSPRPGTPAAGMDEQVPKVVVQERYERLVALQDEMAWAENKALVGRTVEVLVAQGEGRKDGATARLSGRARDNRLVHFTPGPAGSGDADAVPRPDDVDGVPRPGDVVEVEITYAAPHHLVSDQPPSALRRTRAGDTWAARSAAASAPATAPAPGVLLGLPTIGAPRP